MITLLEDSPVTPRVLRDFVDRTRDLLETMAEAEELRRRRSAVLDALDALALERRRNLLALAERHAQLHAILQSAGIVGP